IVSVAPAFALSGERLVSFVSAKATLDAPVPAGVVTDTVPDENVPPGTTAVICVAESTVNDDAATVPNLTADAPVKLSPLNVTLVPAAPSVGESAVTDGTGRNDDADVGLVCAPTVTVSGPLTASVGTVTRTCVGDTAVT